VATSVLLASNTNHFTRASERHVEPYVGLRLLASVLCALAVFVMVVGALIALVVVLGSLGSAGLAARFTPGAVPVGIAGAGFIGGLLVLLGAALQALVLWAAAQFIHLMLSIEGHSREAVAVQRGILAELRKTSNSA
jgi:hypothetical protein